MFDYALRLGKPSSDADYRGRTLKVAGDERGASRLTASSAAVQPIGAPGSTSPRNTTKPPNHPTFSEVSPVVYPTIMQSAGLLNNLGIVFRRALTHSI
jgi:hypothetical protein